MNDLQKLSEKHLFFGDFNCSFSDNYYFTNEGRNLFNENFKILKLKKHYQKSQKISTIL